MKLFGISRLQWALMCVCFSVLFCTACGGTDTIFTVIEASLAGVGIVITGLGALISPGQAALVNGAVTAIGDLVAAVQVAWDTYEANPTAAGALAALQAAVASLQSQIPAIMADLHITNPTLQAWFTTLVGLVGKLAAAIAADILPKLAAAADAHAAGDSTQIKQLHSKFKELTAAFIVAHNEALDNSGLPPETIAAVRKNFDHPAKAHLELSE